MSKKSVTKQTRVRFAAGTLGLILMSATPACHKSHHRQVETEEESPRPASMLAMNNPHAAAQLVAGFYGLESGSWRWTAGKFSVALRPPTGAMVNGARLQLLLTVPEPVIQKLNNTTLSAKVGDTPLEPETYNRSGDYTYSREVPGAALQGDSVRVDFSLNKAIPPGEDRRELGIIVRQVGLLPK